MERMHTKRCKISEKEVILLLSGAAAGRPVDKDMTAFIRRMRAAELEPVGSGMSLLSLGPDVYFPDDPHQGRSMLLVRDFYAKLLEHMKGRRAWLLTGVSGTGKSWWIWYAIYQLLQETEPPAIVWQSYRMGARRVLFKDGMAYGGDRTAFQEELDLESTWFFVDGMLPDMGVVARTVLVCAPDRSIYKEWLKGRSGIQLTMPLWTWPEVEKCWQLLYQNKLTLERVRRNFDLWYGGVPLLVLEDPTSRSDDSGDGRIAMAAIRWTSIEEVNHAIVAQYDAGSDASRLVIHQDGDRSTFLSTTREFATSTVAARFIDQVSSNRAQAQMLSELAGSSFGLDSSRGQIFEALAHKAFLNGGCFDCRFIDVPVDMQYGHSAAYASARGKAAKVVALVKAATAMLGGAGGAAAGEQLKLQLPSFGHPALFTPGAGKDIGDFGSAAGACSAPCYLQPAGPAHPVVDACIYPNILLQCTVAPDRKAIDEELLEQHLQCLPDQPVYYLDYVVPADTYDSFMVPALERKSERVCKVCVRVTKVKLR